MVKEKLGKLFVQEFVLSFGFLSGLWIHVGIDPKAEIIKAFVSIVQKLAPNSIYSVAFWIIPIIAILGSLAGSYFLGGWLGLIAVGLAFLGGIFISSGFGMFCLVAGVILGFIAPYLFLNNKVS